MKLTGDRNQCQACKAYFNSTRAFDKHRTGDFGHDRRCLAEPEMLAKGMAKNTAGFWVSEQMARATAWWGPRSHDRAPGDANLPTH